jgi:4-carboxymuconolactone decarboxylase
MSSDHDGLGGRLPLIDVDALTPEQAHVRDRLIASRGAQAAAAGFAMTTPDGRLIGPFNAYLRMTPIAEALLDWAAAIREYPLPEDVQQVAILTVGVVWDSAFEVYAHVAEARHAGVPADAIDAICAGRTPGGLAPGASIAYDLTKALAQQHRVDDELYARALQHFGEGCLLALVNLIGRYINTAAILACFAVPVPAPAT